MKPISTFAAGSLLALAVGTALAAGSPGVERNTQRFLEALEAGGGQPLETLSPKDARAVLVGAQEGVKVDLSGITVEDRTIQADGRSIPLTIVRPEGARGEIPVFMFFHGGGWVLGDYPTHARLIRDLVVNSGAVAVYVGYTPSPEAKYPVAINQAYAATRWVAEHGREIGVDGSRLAVAGNSVGGNMAAVVALMAKEKVLRGIGGKSELTVREVGRLAVAKQTNSHALLSPCILLILPLSGQATRLSPVAKPLTAPC